MVDSGLVSSTSQARRDIKSGAVKLDGVPIENINKSTLNKQQSIHFSTNELFEASVLDNITVGRTISEERIRQIISLMGLNLFVSHLPNGLDSIVNPSNYFLSKDVTQKILLARALVEHSRLYIFEYPFLYLKQTEKERIIDFMFDDMRESTVIITTEDDYWLSKSEQQIIITKGGGNA